jgi:hypothetical protein
VNLGAPEAGPLATLYAPKTAPALALVHVGDEPRGVALADRVWCAAGIAVLALPRALADRASTSKGLGLRRHVAVYDNQHLSNGQRFLEERTGLPTERIGMFASGSTSRTALHYFDDFAFGVVDSAAVIALDAEQREQVGQRFLVEDRGHEDGLATFVAVWSARLAFLEARLADKP